MQENEVTQADREAAYEFTRTGHIKGSDGIHPLAVAFARHRQQAEDATRERCAAIVDQYAAECNFDEEIQAAETIATSIRAATLSKEVE